MDGILPHSSRAYSLSEPGFPIRSRCLLGEPDVDEFRALGISTTTASNSPCIGALIIGSSGGLSSGSYHGRLSLTPASSDCAMSLPISSPCKLPGNGDCNKGGDCILQLRPER